MKLMHLSDLHLGKRVDEYPMLEDQRYILKEILSIAQAEAPDAVLIAGDVYDKSVAPADAVTLLNDFLVALVRQGRQVFLISGNHDSPERLAFGRELMEASGIHLSPVYAGAVEAVTLEDAYGPVDIYLLPFLKPVQVRRFFETQELTTYTDAVRAAIDQMAIDPTRRNVLLAHQFVTGADRCESEERSVGGSDNVDAAVFAGFDYVALGHLHGPQIVGSPTVRYCGTPLKYSLSEVAHEKSVTIVELKEKGNASVRTVPLKPLRDMVELRGTYDALTARSYYAGKTWQEDYVYITLTDEEDVPDARARLRSIYHNLVKLRYDNQRTRSSGELEAVTALERKSELELFAEFYAVQNNKPMSEDQSAYMEHLISRLKEANV